MKKILVSFGDSRLHKSAKRLYSQAAAMKIYDEIHILNEFHLEDDFKKLFKDKLSENVRGYGYWCWKPQVILQIFESCQENDIVNYMDIGCHLNVNGRSRLVEYFEETVNSDHGMLTFQACEPRNIKGFDGRNLPDMQDIKWIKADLLQYLGVAIDSEILKTQTIAAGVFFIQKNEFTINFLKRWKNVFEKDFSLIDDTPSKIANVSEFIEHRHDQALFSIFCKLDNIRNFSFYETWMPEKNNINKSDFRLLDNYPIHVKRDKKMRPIDYAHKILEIIRGKFRDI